MMKEVQIKKSRCIEIILLGQYTELNAILSICKVLMIALYFFKFTVKSKSLEKVEGIEDVVADHPLTAEDEGLVQFLAICLAAPQNMHSLRYHFCFIKSNLLSLPRTKDTVVVSIEYTMQYNIVTN